MELNQCEKFSARIETGAIGFEIKCCDSASQPTEGGAERSARSRALKEFEINSCDSAAPTAEGGAGRSAVRGAELRSASVSSHQSSG